MADNWQIFPPWVDDQKNANVSFGSQIRSDFDIVKYPSDFEMTTSLHWANLSREEIANLRNLVNSEGLQKLMRSYGYGTSCGAIRNMASEVDPNDAEFDLMIDSKEDIPQAFMSEIISFVKDYRVQ
jgi:hypothetical protein